MTQDGAGSRYVLELVRTSDGITFGRRNVPESYLESAKEDVIFRGQRRGDVGADPTGVCVADSPVFSADATAKSQGEIQGIEMKLVDADATDPLSVFFDTGLFQPFAQRIALELVNAKQIAATDDIRARVFANGNYLPTKPGNNGATVVREPLPLLEGNLEDLLSKAIAVGPVNNADYPVFVTPAVLERAHEFVWQRNRERGVWLLGNVVLQQKPHEIFGIVHTVFEARGTKHERFSIDFTTETFTHAQQQLERFRTRFGRIADVLMGFYHSHPFLPSILDGMEACPTCSLRATCKLTSSFFSQRDQAFHAAMFGAAPYAVEIVLGLTPREEFDVKMFCYDGGRFRERGYYQLTELPATLFSEGELQP